MHMAGNQLIEGVRDPNDRTRIILTSESERTKERAMWRPSGTSKYLVASLVYNCPLDFRLARV